MRRLAIALVLITLWWGCKDDSESAREGDGGYSRGGGSGTGDAGKSGHGGSGGDTTASDGGVPGDKRLGELSEGERLKVCNTLGDSVDTDSARRGTCVLGASIAVSVA